MAETHYDMIVVGGGIHGAGVAQAAAASGNSVLLLEKSAIGSATSSKSSKLIHGGLRYLESFQFGLVRECLRERALLLRNAPELVKLAPFYIPVYQHTSRRPWKIGLGLQLYRWLGGFNSDSRFRRLTRRQWQSLNGLIQTDLQAVFQYYDAQTDDIALTKAVLQSAQQLGAEVLLPAAFEGAVIHQDQCEIHVAVSGKKRTYTSAVLVNAAGAWVNEILRNCSPRQCPLEVDYVQGTHIVVNEPAKPGVFYLEAPQDQRAVFVMPWKGQCMIGTTETVFHGDAGDVRPLAAEKNYLLDTYNHYFCTARAESDIVSAFAGLRVLPRDSKTPFKRARDTLLLANTQSRPRLISIYGGKLTAYRSTAEKVMQRLRGSMPSRKPRGNTRSLALQPAGQAISGR
ncbi:MAG: glycerol-3-phosphate dehydrogenase/oxidase [Gammaproteobacteria bacterium]|nr:glycerol-3-phosphate dehydrogenase/oxidase [Gammaproteobacteria bacterium]